MKLRMIFAALTLFSLAVVACEPDENPSQTRLESAESLWQEKGPAGYEYEYSRVCECEDLGNVTVRVTDGVVVSATSSISGALPAAELDEIPTVDSLFDNIQKAIDEGAEVVDATYDATLGFPTAVTIDYDDAVMDDEITFYADDFTAL